MIFEVTVRVEVDDDLGLVGAAKMVRERLSMTNVEILGLTRITDDNEERRPGLDLNADTEM